MANSYGPKSIVTDNLSLYYDFLNSRCYTSGATTATNLGSLNVTATIPAAWAISSGHLAPSATDATFSSPSGIYIDKDNSTYEFWLYPTNLQDGLIQTSTFGASGPGIQLHWVDTGGGGAGSPMDLYIRGSSYTAYHAVESITQNSWNHVAITFSGTTATLYTNGSLFGSGTVTAIVSHNSTQLGPPYHLNGNYLDIWRIYHKVLTAGEVLQNYNAQKSRFGL